jgi:NAD+ diphosphatase
MNCLWRGRVACRATTGGARLRRAGKDAAMRIAESVTFGGSGLDRGAGLRKDAAALAGLLREGRVLPVWRGKPLCDGGAGLGWVGAESAVLAGAGPAVFLGMDDGVARFAADISHWAPEAGAAAVEGGFFDATEQRHPALDDRFAFLELRGVMTLLTAREAELAATAKAVLHWHRSHGFCATCGAATVMEAGGWQRACPACGAQHFPRTDPVVIMLITRGNRVLVGRNANWPEGMYSLLAGFVEPGETLEAAVRREVFEEAGVRVGAVRYLASQPWPFPASLMFGCAGEALDEAIRLDPDELEDAVWVTREEMVAAMAGRHPRIRPARKGAIAHFLIANWLADRLD